MVESTQQNTFAMTEDWVGRMMDGYVELLNRQRKVYTN